MKRIVLIEAARAHAYKSRVRAWQADGKGWQTFHTFTYTRAEMLALSHFSSFSLNVNASEKVCWYKIRCAYTEMPL